MSVLEFLAWLQEEQRATRGLAKVLPEKLDSPSLRQTARQFLRSSAMLRGVGRYWDFEFMADDFHVGLLIKIQLHFFIGRFPLNVRLSDSFADIALH